MSITINTGNVKMTPAEVADEYEKFFKNMSVVCRCGAARRACIQYEEYDFAKTLPAPKPEEAPEFWCEVEHELERRGYWVEGDTSDTSKVYLYRRVRKIGLEE